MGSSDWLGVSEAVSGCVAELSVGDDEVVGAWLDEAAESVVGE